MLFAASSTLLPAALAGVGLGLSLIVAIGAQNLFVLRQGIRREYVLAVALVCAISDALLIAIGVSGLGVILEAVPWLIGAVRWAGAAFLLVYAALAARRAIRPGGETLDADAAGNGTATATRGEWSAVFFSALALTWLNPHVYLDTVFLLGSIAATHGEDRWWFAAGAMTASFVWFFTLAFGARALGRWLRAPRAWRILDGIIAVVMTAIAVSLIWPQG